MEVAVVVDESKKLEELSICIDYTVLLASHADCQVAGLTLFRGLSYIVKRECEVAQS